MLNFKVAMALFRKDMRTYLGNPTGYVFITLFIITTCAAAFLQEEFFTRNLADLATLNSRMPVILMLFVPAISMNAWADERRAGTDELLLTLSVRDGEIVLGKYLGVLGMYTVSLALTAVAQLSVLMYLGEPDKGLMFSTFAGYWLMGALFIAVSMVGSMLTLNTTVAFILGLVGCSLLVFTGTLPWASGGIGLVLIGLLAALCWWAIRGNASGSGLVGLAGALLAALMWQSRNISDEPSEAAATGDAAAATSTPAAEGGEAGVETVTDLSTQFEEIFGSLSVSDHFTSFGEGVIRLGDVAYFMGGVAVMLYLCTLLLGRRHW